jgi:hypothetical protein
MIAETNLPGRTPPDFPQDMVADGPVDEIGEQNLQPTTLRRHQSSDESGVTWIVHIKTYLPTMPRVYFTENSIRIDDGKPPFSQQRSGAHNFVDLYPEVIVRV